MRRFQHLSLSTSIRVARLSLPVRCEVHQSTLFSHLTETPDREVREGGPSKSPSTEGVAEESAYADILRWERCGRPRLLFEVPSTVPPTERVARNLLSDVISPKMTTSCGSQPCPARNVPGISCPQIKFFQPSHNFAGHGRLARSVACRESALLSRRPRLPPCRASTSELLIRNSRNPRYGRETSNGSRK